MSDEARYLYCVVKKEEELLLGNIGIEESSVYIVHHKDIAAVIHSCKPVPYDTTDHAKAEGWVLEHSYVIDQVMKKFGTVLPFSFDVIVRGDDDTIRCWLDQNYDNFKEELDRFENKSEYSVQIFYDYDKYVSKALTSNKDLLSLKEKIDNQSKGKAYLLQRNLDLKLKDAVSADVRKQAEIFEKEIISIANEVKADERPLFKPDNKYKDKNLMASFSCLVHIDKVELLGTVLEKINNLDGLAVRFTGPWAPFSFVDLEGAKT
jgi:hypothetical protein